MCLRSAHAWRKSSGQKLSQRSWRNHLSCLKSSLQGAPFRMRVEVSTGVGTKCIMKPAKFVCWQEDGAWLGYLQAYPRYWTQGKTLADLQAHLEDIRETVESGDLPEHGPKKRKAPRRENRLLTRD